MGKISGSTRYQIEGAYTTRLCCLSQWYCYLAHFPISVLLLATSPISQSQCYYLLLRPFPNLSVITCYLTHFSISVLLLATSPISQSQCYYLLPRPCLNLSVITCYLAPCFNLVYLFILTLAFNNNSYNHTRIIIIIKRRRRLRI